MTLEKCNPEQIWTLNEIGKQLQDVDVRIPSTQEQEEAKKIIEQILPPADAGRVNLPYVRSVLIAFQYAMEHVKPGNSMMEDIKSGKKIVISDYTFVREENIHEQNTEV